jgi:integrase
MDLLEAHLRKLGTVLRYGIAKGYLKENPVARIDKPELERDEVQVASVETVRALFADALANDIEMIPFLVFSFFCGIRPGGEIERLEWNNVRGGEVVLKGGQAKTERKRAIPLSECATAWLNRYVELGGIREGKVVKRTKDQLFDYRRRNWKATGHDAIPQDIARHTFCSHYLAKTGDLTKSLLASGHTDPTVFWQHYYQHVTAEETTVFWSIMPPDCTTKVVAFPQVA